MNESTVKQVCNIATSVVSALALTLNACGIYLLKASHIGASNQVKLIMNVSVCDVIISSASLTLMSLDLCGYHLPESGISLAIWASRTAVFHAWYCMFYLLTLDRFLGCNFPFKYRAMTGGKTCKITLLIAWMIPVILIPLFCFLDTKAIRIFYNKSMWISLDATFLCLFAITYSSVFYQKKRRNSQFQIKNAGSDNQRFFAVTTAILVAFLFLETIPAVISAILITVDPKRRDMLSHYFELVWNCNLLSDPLIYVFLQRNVRATALSKLRHFFGLVRKVHVVEIEMRTFNISRDNMEIKNAATNSS